MAGWAGAPGLRDAHARRRRRSHRGGARGRRAAAAAAARLSPDAGVLASRGSRSGAQVHGRRGRPARVRRQRAPPRGAGHAGYSKRAMAADMVAVMRGLGHPRFAVAGHDRGGRVAHRMALDHPDVVERAAVLDIVPTRTLFARSDQAFATAYYHWFFLIQPGGLPETMIGHDPEWFLRETLRRWSGARRAPGRGGDRRVRALLPRPGRDPRLVRGLPGRGDHRPGARRRGRRRARRVPAAGALGRARGHAPPLRRSGDVAGAGRGRSRPHRALRPFPARGGAGRDRGRPRGVLRDLDST